MSSIIETDSEVTFYRLPSRTIEVYEENTAFGSIKGAVFHTCWSEAVHTPLDFIPLLIDQLSLKDCEEVI